MENENNKESKKNTLKFKLIYINILIFISIIISLFMFLLNPQAKTAFGIYLFLYIPILLLFLFKFLMKLSKINWLSALIGIIAFGYVILYAMYIFTLSMFCGLLHDLNREDSELFKTRTPTIEEYYEVMSNAADKPYQIKHFPIKIPEKAYNYYCERENDPRGFNIHYVKFNIDDKYLNEIIKQNNKNINEKINMADINQYYRYIDLRLKLEDEEKYDAYILKNENNDDTYTSGFIISKEKHEIIFFYANYNLKN